MRCRSCAFTRVTLMPKFNFDVFADILRNAPDRRGIFEQEEHSAYLQENVFDPLIEDDVIDIKEVDFSKFELKNVTTNKRAEGYRRVNEGWTHGFNSRVKQTPAAVTAEHGFF